MQCTLVGCERPLLRLGLCIPHTRRRLKYGDPLAGPPMRRQRGSSPPPCSVDDCAAPARCNTFCEAHDRRWKLYGDPLGQPDQKPLTQGQKDALAAGRLLGRAPRLTREQRDANDRQAKRAYARRHRSENPERARADRRAQMASYGPEYRHRWNHRNRLRRLALAPPDALSEDYALLLRNDPCSYCGAPVEHIDHIEPIARGGNGSWMNLTGACARCNFEKAARPLLAFLLARVTA